MVAHGVLYGFLVHSCQGLHVPLYSVCAMCMRPNPYPYISVCCGSFRRCYIAFYAGCIHLLHNHFIVIKNLLWERVCYIAPCGWLHHEPVTCKLHCTYHIIIIIHDSQGRVHTWDFRSQVGCFGQFSLCTCYDKSPLMYIRKLQSFSLYSELRPFYLGQSLDEGTFLKMFIPDHCPV